MVDLADDLREASFLQRPNRFVVVADLDGRNVEAHCPNPGRLSEFLHEGNPFLLAPATGDDRATDWDVVAGRHNDGWVVLDTRRANDVVAEALDTGRFDDDLGPIEDWAAEPGHGDGRLDFAVETPDGRVLVEVKSVTLLDEDDGETGLFPDAPTERGTRHVHELAEHAGDGGQAALVLVAMRSDVERIRPHREMDPAFADAVEDAVHADVDLLGYRTRLEDGDLGLGEAVPVAPV